MQRMSPRSLVRMLIALSIASLAILARQPWRDLESRSGAREFQQLVGGLGLGIDADGSRCRRAFDLRLSGECSRVYGTIPSGKRFCPCHGASLFELDETPE